MNEQPLKLYNCNIFTVSPPKMNPPIPNEILHAQLCKCRFVASQEALPIDPLIASRRIERNPEE